MKYLSSHSIMFEIPPISTYIYLLYHPIDTILYYIIKLFHAAKSLYVFSVHYVVRISSTCVPDAYAD